MFNTTLKHKRNAGHLLHAYFPGPCTISLHFSAFYFLTGFVLATSAERGVVKMCDAHDATSLLKHNKGQLELSAEPL